MEVCQYPFSPISVKTATGRWYIKARNRIGIRASPLSCSFKKKNETTPRVREYSRVLLEARKFNAGIPHEIFPNFTCGEIFSRNHLDCRQNRRLFPSPSLSLILFSPAICTFHKPFCFLSPTLPPSSRRQNKLKEGEGGREEGKRKNTQRDSGWKRSTYVTLRVRTSTYICFPLFKDLFDIVTKVRRFDSFPLLSERISSLPIISSYTKRYASRRRKKREKEIECICEKKDILESFIFFQIHVSRWDA